MRDYAQKYINPLAREIVEDHIDRYGMNTHILVGQLTENDLKKFTRVLKDEERDLSFLLDSDDLNCLTSICFRTDSKEDKIIMTENILDKITQYYKPRMQEILDDMQTSIFTEYHELHGFRKVKDIETGEVRWSK